ncbi:TraK family protein [Pseudomonas syringae]|uniref:TraK family protein n=1 Tax=Pseudomonas syringae TaxID=317 RepID=UPI0006E6CCD9|nr:TraK family protein [Pseudomonas syringae]KPY47131.1 hypothetical protein ALO48_200145 [Pseudomonas syringae pv. rhaphiolepidis]KWS39472.1 hypothetical protein AL060_20275 [Pseudomonas syringae pv. rhaphiolepidis]
MKDWRSAPRNGKAAFLEHREAIQAKLESGYTFKAIYDQLVASKSLSMSQSQFNRYVKALLVAPALQPAVANTQPQTAPQTAPGVRRFTHNPTPPENLLD